MFVFYHILSYFIIFSYMSYMFSNSPPTDPKSRTSTLDLTEESKKLTSSPHLVAEIATHLVAISVISSLDNCRDRLIIWEY